MAEEPVVLVLFHFPPKTAAREVTKLSQQLYGRTVRTWKGRYEYHRDGVLETIPHRRLGRGAIVLRKRDWKTVKELLDEFGAVAETRIIQPTREDTTALRDIPPK